jgi:hypothetical protein
VGATGTGNNARTRPSPKLVTCPCTVPSAVRIKQNSNRAWWGSGRERRGRGRRMRTCDQSTASGVLN